MIPGSANLFYRTLLMLGGSQEVADGGSGYTVGDVLTVAGGASATAGTVTVDSVLQTAGGFTPGSSYTIVSAGDTDFTAIGAANNNPGTTFTASGAGSGTGTASTATAAEVGKVHTVTVTEPGKYAVVPTSPASTTGGTGSGAKVTPGWTVWVFTGGPKASGGAITTDGAYTIHTFTADGTFTVLQAPLTIDYLNVGGGGAETSGGGGGGELSYVEGYELVSTGDNSVTVGAAGFFGGDNGGNTTFITTAVGGGGGGETSIGSDGACGGGAGSIVESTDTFAGGIGSVGGNGGAGVNGTAQPPGISSRGSGGGGGMGGNGTDGSPGQGGNGGDGVSNSISGSAVYYSAGGSGGGDIANGTDGAGIGSPGGGGGADAFGAQDGIVIIRYLT